MSLVKYEILSTVAEVQSFTKAAEELGLTQSAISHAISSLEKEFGFALIHRSRNGVKLTADGTTMLRSVRKILFEEELLRQEASKILGVAEGTVRVGLISSISSKWMPNIIRIMDQQFPGIRIELREGDYYEIEQWLISGEVDCGFLNRTSSKQFDFIPLKRDPLVGLVSPKSRFYNEEELDIFEVGKEQIIMPVYKGINDVEMNFEKFNIKPTIRFQLFDEIAIISMVEHHLGISILPQLAISYLPNNVKAIPFKQDCFRTIGLSTKQKLSPAATKFVEVLKDWLQQRE